MEIEEAGDILYSLGTGEYRLKFSERHAIAKILDAVRAQQKTISTNGRLLKAARAVAFTARNYEQCSMGVEYSDVSEAVNLMRDILEVESEPEYLGDFSRERTRKVYGND